MKSDIHQLLSNTLRKLGLPCDISKISVEIPRQTSHGNYTSNVALVLAKTLSQNPRQLAEKIVQAMGSSPKITQIKIEGPGFINFFLSPLAEYDLIPQILEKKEQFGHSTLGAQKKVIVEFVSVNPTGPIHIGHGRGAMYGAAISDLLEAIGYAVHREYYVNDAGRQIDILLLSVWLRYLELNGVNNIVFPDSCYQGDYIKETAVVLKQQWGDHLKPKQLSFPESASGALSQKSDEDIAEAIADQFIEHMKQQLSKDDFQTMHRLVLDRMLKSIREELEALGIHYQQWTSEAEILKGDAIEKSFKILRDRKLLYEKEGATWFRSTDFGDDKDRVVIRKDGRLTYFASDIAYHWNKIQRGFERMITVLGADHHGYVARLKAIVAALGFDPHHLEIPIVQIAHLYRNGKQIKMSKRTGEFETLTQLREEVGADATRFFYLEKSIDQQMNFDLDLAKEQSNKNPVYYIQYAHARIESVFEQLNEKQWTFDAKKGLPSLPLLTSAYEKNLLAQLNRYEESVIQAAQKLEPHRIAHYLYDLANHFHVYYNAEHFLVEEENLRNARLCLIKAVQQILFNGLILLGISAPKKM